jgi:glycosyltransferase involved in cell wall biosynthesis
MDDRLTSAPGATRRSHLFVCDEWSATKGGISVLNRKLAVTVARQGHESMCLVRSATNAEHEDAARHGVRLFTAERTPAGPDLHLPVAEVLDRSPDIVIGHDRVSGHIAWLYARKYGHARLVHIVHTAPAEIEPYKGRLDAAQRVEDREAFTTDIARHTDVIAAVGPRLTRYVTGLLEDGYGDVSVFRLDPCLDLDEDAAGRRRRIPSRPNVMVLGRTGDIELKGLDIASGAVAALTPRAGQPPPVLFVRGAPAPACEQVRTTLVAASGLARGRVDVRPFTENAAAVRRDLRHAALCVMPSRAEGFGLVAWEAIAVGTPVLVSSQSGAAELLRERLGATAERMVVDVTDTLSQDVRAWHRAISLVLDDLPSAFAFAHEVRTELAGPPWSSVIDSLHARLYGARPAEPRRAEGHGAEPSSVSKDSASLASAAPILR